VAAGALGGGDEVALVVTSAGLKGAGGLPSQAAPLVRDADELAAVLAPVIGDERRAPA
jgi:hypothetical protein